MPVREEGNQVSFFLSLVTLQGLGFLQDRPFQKKFDPRRMQVVLHFHRRSDPFIPIVRGGVETNSPLGTQMLGQKWPLKQVIWGLGGAYVPKTWVLDQLRILYPVKHRQEPKQWQAAGFKGQAPLGSGSWTLGFIYLPAERSIVWELGRRPFRTHLEHILEKPTLECEVEYR